METLQGGESMGAAVKRAPRIFAVCLGFFLLLLSDLAFARPVTLHVVDADVRAVLATVAELGGVGLVLDDSVQGTITIHLDEVEPEEAFAMIAAADDLSLGESGGATIITAARTGAQGLYRPYVFPVRYAEVDTVAEAVSLSLMPYDNEYNGRLQTTGRDGQAEDAKNGADRTNRNDSRILADAATGSVVLYGTASEAKAAEKLIAALDQPPPQVSLEAKVVALDKEAAKELGVEWEWSKVPQYPEHSIEYRTRTYTTEGPGGKPMTVTEEIPYETTTRHWNDGSVPGIIRFGRGPGGFPFEFYYGAKINALISDGKANLLARPNITTLQGREAVINIGGEVPVPTVSVTNSTTTTSVTYREAGIILRCTPRVGPDGAITAKVHTEVSSPHYVSALSAYRFNKRSADTEVRLRDGETMVIGGLIGSEESKVMSKIPFLGDLPILGVFFRNVRTSKTDSEVMIFLTAKVVDDNKELSLIHI